MTEDKHLRRWTLVFAIARRKTHSQLAKRELNQSLEHFMLAATHIARSTGATMGPKVQAARERVSPAADKVRDAANSSWGSTMAALAPLAAAATDSARKASTEARKTNQRGMKAIDKKAQKMARKASRASSNSGSRLTKLLIAGAVVGAAGALMMRRRKQQAWDEYDPSRPAGGARTEDRTPPDTSITMSDPTSQTSSGMHSPTVSRMADGSISGAEASTRNPTL